MKKFFKSLVAVMLVAITAIAFTSCGVPADPAKAEENLKANEYVVDKVAAKVVVSAYVGASYGLGSAGKVGDVIFATNGDDAVLVVYSDDADLLKSLNEDLVELFKEVKKDAEEDVDLVKGKSGKCVWVGTKAGVKAAG
ncbi:MAG: hypothetical protein IJC87_04050 [Clostridia bacterium]|nr:hypothetical protein [Clostridia bacterium]